MYVYTLLENLHFTTSLSMEENILNGEIPSRKRLLPKISPSKNASKQ